MSKRHSEELLDSMIKHAGHEILAEMAAKAPKNKEIKDVVGDTDALDKRMQKVINRHQNRQRMRKTGKVMSRIAAVIAVLVIVTGVAIVSSDALRIRFLNLFHSSSEISTEIEITDKELPKAQEAIVEPKYLPGGYELVETSSYPGMFISYFQNKKSEKFEIEQIDINTEISLNTELINYREIKIGGKDAYVTVEQDMNNLQFYSNEYAFFIYGDLSIDEMIRIAESIVE